MISSRVIRYSAFGLSLLLFSSFCRAELQRKIYSSAQGWLAVEILEDNLAHFAFSKSDPAPDNKGSIPTSPMVFKTDYNGPSIFKESGNSLETKGMRIEIDPANLAITIRDKMRNDAVLTVIHPAETDDGRKRLEIERGAMQNVYGLGQQFIEPGTSDGDWTTFKTRKPAVFFGNGMRAFSGGATGNIQIPIMYAVGPEHLNYALFLDDIYRQVWDFSTPAWSVQMSRNTARFYVFTGPDLPSLRRGFMALTGKPPVPPRKMFGLWVSQFGYKNFDEVNALRQGLRENGFPVDGFVLDLNWFGGVGLNNPVISRMGRLDWDESDTDGNAYFFPKPAEHIQAFAADHVGIATIEEPFLANTTDTYRDIPARLSAFRCGDGKPITDITGFWGIGKMLDWSNPEAGRFIHDQRRFPNLVKKGVTVHWTDLGEPESFDPAACYFGNKRQPDVHNLYNFFWDQSIWDGYYEKRGQANDLGQVNPRPFILSRSGTAGIQRFGAALWSGDIGANLDSLATHLNAQMQMSFSGIDFYGSDVGGFRREAMPANDSRGNYRGYEQELYTQWFANACWFDVPIRPHTDNQFVLTAQPYSTAPYLVGKKADNLANLRQRYELTPYYYSLAWRAHLEAEPLIPPVVFYYQDDPNVRLMGNEKLVGRDLLVAAIANHGEYQRDVYLPAGEWVNYHTNEWIASQGETFHDIPAYQNGIFQLPVFARAGAILPQMHVDELTLDTAGHRAGGAKTRDDLIVKVFASAKKSAFLLYEDDGWSLDYDAQKQPLYRHRTTELTQEQPDSSTVKVTIGRTEKIEGLPAHRQNVIRLVVENARAKSVDLNGSLLEKYPTKAAFDGAESGWWNAGPNLIEAKSLTLSVSKLEKSFVFHLESTPLKTSVQFVCADGWTTPGESIYVIGSLPELGSWDPAKAIKLSPSVYYEYIWNPPASGKTPGPKTPAWTGTIPNLPTETEFSWKFVRKWENAVGETRWQPGAAHTFKTGKSGYSGSATSSGEW